MNKNKELYIEEFRERYILSVNWKSFQYEGRKLAQIEKELNKLLPIELQKFFIDIKVGNLLYGFDDLKNVRDFLYKQGRTEVEPEKWLEVVSNTPMNYKEGEVYSFKYVFEDFYRFFVVIKEVGNKDCYIHILKTTSKEPQIDIKIVGWEDVLTKLPLKINRDTFSYDKAERYYKLVKENVEINKEELNFLEYIDTDEETNEDKCFDIYGNEIKGQNMLTANPLAWFSVHIYTYISVYEQYQKYVGEEKLELFKYGNNFEDYIDINYEEITEIPEEIMKLVYETDIPAPENKYKSVRVKKSEDEYYYFKQLDNYLLEVSEEISSATLGDIDSEDMTGENYEVLIRFYLEEKEFDLKDIYSDSSSDIISFISKEEKKLREVVKEINKFLKNKKKLIKYVSENYEQIDWI